VREGEEKRQDSSLEVQRVGVSPAGSRRTWGEESNGRRPHQGMKSPWETPPGFQHQNVKEGLIKRTKKDRDLKGVKSRFI
jgi:hypothetical protein